MYENSQNARFLHDSCPKKIAKYPNFCNIFPKKINKIPEFYMIFARKCPNFT